MNDNPNPMPVLTQLTAAEQIVSNLAADYRPERSARAALYVLQARLSTIDVLSEQLYAGATEEMRGTPALIHALELLRDHRRTTQRAYDQIRGQEAGPAAPADAAPPRRGWSKAAQRRARSSPDRAAGNCHSCGLPNTADHIC